MKYDAVEGRSEPRGSPCQVITTRATPFRTCPAAEVTVRVSEHRSTCVDLATTVGGDLDRNAGPGDVAELGIQRRGCGEDACNRLEDAPFGETVALEVELSRVTISIR